MAGFEFIERANENDAVESVICQSWSSRQSKMLQPNLDFMGKGLNEINMIICMTMFTNKTHIITFKLLTAPEIQMTSNCSILSDMFSLGMVICAIFNNGHPLIQANNSTSAYLKQLEMVRNSYELVNPLQFPYQVKSEHHRPVVKKTSDK